MKNHQILSSMALLLLVALIQSPSAKAGQSEYMRLKDVSFAQPHSGNSTEKVCFRFDSDEVPTVHSLSGDNPRLFFDLRPCLQEPEKRQYVSQGELVEKVRMYLHKAEKRPRVVVDLDASLDYRVQQFYHPEERMLCLVVDRLESSVK